MEQELLKKIEELEEENKKLKFQLEVTKISTYHISGIVNNKRVKKTRNILLADRYDLEAIVYLVNAFGYEYVNEYFMNLIDEKEKEEVEEDGE